MRRRREGPAVLEEGEAPDLLAVGRQAAFIERLDELDGDLFALAADDVVDPRGPQ